MSKGIYWHNPRCSKSRQALTLLENEKVDLDIIKYLDEPPDESQLKAVLAQLNMAPRDLMRKNEAIYKELNLNETTLSDDELIAVMVKNPKLIERPVLIVGDKAVLGRPPERVLEII